MSEVKGFGTSELRHNARFALVEVPCRPLLERLPSFAVQYYSFLRCTTHTTTTGARNRLIGQDIIYVDDDIVVANKPSNLLCVPGRVEKDSLATRFVQGLASAHYASLVTWLVRWTPTVHCWHASCALYGVAYGTLWLTAAAACRVLGSELSRNGGSNRSSSYSSPSRGTLFCSSILHAGQRWSSDTTE